MSDNGPKMLIVGPTSGLQQPDSGAEKVLSRIVSDALAIARGREVVDTLARIRLGKYDLCQSDYRQIDNKHKNQFTSDINPEDIADGLIMTGYHVEAGAHLFADYAKAMIADLGDAIKPYLKTWYMGLKHDNLGADFYDRMSSAAEVEAFDIDSLDEDDAGTQFNSRIDSELWMLVAEHGAFYLEGGVRKFAEFAHTMSNDLGISIAKLKPYLRSCYNGARDMMEDAGHDISSFDAPETTKDELARLLKAEASNESRKLDEPIKGLTAPLGGDNRFGGGLTFDDETYAKAKPHFQAMLADTEAAGKDLRDFIQLVVRSFGSGVKPYILKFAGDLREEYSNGRNRPNDNSGDREGVSPS